MKKKYAIKVKLCSINYNRYIKYKYVKYKINY